MGREVRASNTEQTPIFCRPQAQKTGLAGWVCQAYESYRQCANAMLRAHMEASILCICKQEGGEKEKKEESPARI